MSKIKIDRDLYLELRRKEFKLQLLLEQKSIKETIGYKVAMNKYYNAAKRRSALMREGSEV